ncbi:MAG: hypothetical protein MK538_04765 [Planctomycetes bacterium]|nr:hypothetical protein [Planctomycetota bacterium]
MNRTLNVPEAMLTLVLGLGTSLSVVTAQGELPTEAGSDSESVETQDVSEELRGNLEETIRLGEPVLHGLPAGRIRITRARVANLKRHLKRKESERKDLQESLAVLRADFYRRTAALTRNAGRIPEKELKQSGTRLREDYELHAESFERELEALDDDIVAIREKIRELELKNVIAQSLRASSAASREVETTDVGERVLRLPQKLNPFEMQSLVGDARGRDYAPKGVLWALQAEIAFQLGRYPEAERYWIATLDAPVTKDESRPAILTNLAHIAYRRGDFVASYKLYAKAVGEREIDTLSPTEAYTLAVLSYLNGLVEDARVYLSHAGDDGRSRMSGVLNPSDER